MLWDVLVASLKRGVLGKEHMDRLDRSVSEAGRSASSHHAWVEAFPFLSVAVWERADRCPKVAVTLSTLHSPGEGVRALRLEGNRGQRLVVPRRGFRFNVGTAAVNLRECTAIEREREGEEEYLLD